MENLKQQSLRIHTELERRTEDISETFQTEKRVKKSQSQMKSTINEVRNTPDAMKGGWKKQKNKLITWRKKT